MKFAVAHPEKEMRAKIETCTRLLYAIEYHVVFYHPIITLAAERKSMRGQRFYFVIQTLRPHCVFAVIVHLSMWCCGFLLGLRGQTKTDRRRNPYPSQRNSSKHLHTRNNRIRQFSDTSDLYSRREHDSLLGVKFPLFFWVSELAYVCCETDGRWFDLERVRP